VYLSFDVSHTQTRGCLTLGRGTQWMEGRNADLEAQLMPHVLDAQRRARERQPPPGVGWLCGHQRLLWREEVLVRCEVCTQPP